MKNGKYSLFYNNKSKKFEDINYLSRIAYSNSTYYSAKKNIDIYKYEIDDEYIHLLNKNDEFGQNRIRTEKIEYLANYTIESIRRRYIYEFALGYDNNAYSDDGYRRGLRNRLYQVILCDIVNGYYPHSTTKISDPSIKLVKEESKTIKMKWEEK